MYLSSANSYAGISYIGNWPPEIVSPFVGVSSNRRYYIRNHKRYVR